MAFRLSAGASRDIVEIIRHSARTFGESQARRYHAELLATFALLDRLPHINRERADFTPPIRIHPTPPHLIAYRQQDADILIIRVLHTRQHWQRFL